MTSGEVDAAAVAERLRVVRERIGAVDRPWSHKVTITAVTKSFAPEAIEAAVNAGCTSIGENYAQELLSKTDVLDRLGDRRPSVEFIGQLQSNKVRQLVGVVDLWASVDRRSLIDEIANRNPGASVLIQVNSTGEESKGGCPVADVVALVGYGSSAGLSVEGLMTVGPTGKPAEAARPGFDRVRSLTDELGFEVCSMGMSADIEVAVSAGSTNVRIGTGLFGPRVARST